MSDSNHPWAPGCAMRVTRLDDGLTIEVPPAGAWKGSGGLMKDAVVWNVLLGLVTCLMVWGFIRIGKLPNFSFPLLLFLSLWLVGIGMLLHALLMGQRKAALAVRNGRLMFVQTGRFGSKQKEWPPGGVSAIRVGPSIVSRPPGPYQVWIAELQILDSDRRKFGLLVGRDSRELEWLAYELREALGLSWPDVDDLSLMTPSL